MMPNTPSSRAFSALSRPVAVFALAALLSGCLGSVQVRQFKAFAALDYGLPEKEVTLGGVRLVYVDLPAKAKTDEVIVLLSPSLMPLSIWRDVAPALTEVARVIAVDLPGFGKSDKPPRFRYHPEAFAAVLARLLDHLKVASVNLVGNSVGGGTALAFALRHPERTRRLVLAAPAGVGAVAPWKQRVVRWAIQPRSLRASPWFARFVITQGTFARASARTDAIVSDFIAVRGAGAEFDAWVTAQRKVLGNGGRYDVLDRVRAIAAPALVVWGDQDRIFPVARGTLLTQRMKAAELVVLPGVGHMPEAEVPDALVKLVTGFMRRTRPSPSVTAPATSPTGPAKPAPDAADKNDKDGDKDDDKDDDKDEPGDKSDLKRLPQPETSPFKL